MEATVVVIEPHNFKTFALPTNSFHIFYFVRFHSLIGLTY